MKKTHMIVILCFICCLASCTDNPATPENEPSYGIVDFVSVNGMKLYHSTANQLQDVMGQPAGLNTQGDYSYFYYPAQGLKFTLNKSDRVVAVNAYSSSWKYHLEGDTTEYEDYAYETVRGIPVGSSHTPMDSVVSRYGEPSVKEQVAANSSSDNLLFFQYSENVAGRIGVMRFYFFGADSSDYAGKPITRIMMY